MSTLQLSSGNHAESALFPMIRKGTSWPGIQATACQQFRPLAPFWNIQLVASHGLARVLNFRPTLEALCLSLKS
jgi:hypothetical protein